MHTIVMQVIINNWYSWKGFYVEMFNPFFQLKGWLVSVSSWFKLENKES